MMRAREFYRDYASNVAAGPKEGSTPPTPEERHPDPPALEDVREDEPAARFLLSVTDRGRITRLHRADGCWRAVARSFKHFQLVQEEVVEESRYDLICKDCFPEERLPKGPAPAGESSDDSEDVLESAASSDSSSNDEGSAE